MKKLVKQCGFLQHIGESGLASSRRLELMPQVRGQLPTLNWSIGTRTWVVTSVPRTFGNFISTLLLLLFSQNIFEFLFWKCYQSLNTLLLFFLLLLVVVLLFTFYTGVYLIKSVALVSGVQQSDSVYTYTCIYSFSNSFPI